VIDRDEDNVVTAAELDAYIERMAAQDTFIKSMHASSPEEAAQTLLKLLDADGDHLISRDEFRHGFEKLKIQSQLRVGRLKVVWW